MYTIAVKWILSKANLLFTQKNNELNKHKMFKNRYYKFVFLFKILDI